MMLHEYQRAVDDIPWLPNHDRDAAFDRLLIDAATRRCGAAFRCLHALVQASDFLADVQPDWDRLARTWDEWPAERVRRRATSPLFRGWLFALTAIAVSDAWSPDEPRIAALARMAANMAWDWTSTPRGAPIPVHGRRGVVETWDCRFFLDEGPGVDAVTLVREEGGVLVRRAGGELRIPEAFLAGASAGEARLGTLVRAATLPDSAIAVCNRLPSLQVHLPERALPERDAPMDDNGAGAHYYHFFDPTPYVECAGLLARAWPVEYASWREHMHVYVPRTVPPGWYVGGFTSSRWQGAAWIVVNNDALLLETLAHEQSHVRLRYIDEIAPLLAVRDDRRFRVGWRDDPRPIVGLVEGIYVHIHSIEALVRTAPQLDRAGAEQALARAQRLAAQVAEASLILRREARFTAAGESFQGWVESWLRNGPLSRGLSRPRARGAACDSLA